LPGQPNPTGENGAFLGPGLAQADSLARFHPWRRDRILACDFPQAEAACWLD
jgi:hypothetical protein